MVVARPEGFVQRQALRLDRYRNEHPNRLGALRAFVSLGSGIAATLAHYYCAFAPFLDDLAVSGGLTTAAVGVASGIVVSKASRRGSIAKSAIIAEHQEARGTLGRAVRGLNSHVHSLEKNLSRAERERALVLERLKSVSVVDPSLSALVDERNGKKEALERLKQNFKNHPSSTAAQVLQRKSLGTQIATARASLYEVESRIVGSEALIIFDAIGSGGTADVYKAYSPTLDRYLAIKVIKNDAGAEAVRRFHREATTLAEIVHENVQRVFCSRKISIGGQFYDSMVSEFIEGSTLKELIEYGNLTTSQKIGIIKKMAEGLKAVHSSGITHRDLKPENVIVSIDPETGEISLKLIDFGLARNEAATGTRATVDATQVAGTLGYMPHEAFAALDNVHRESDIYALGVIMLELLTGELRSAPEGVNDYFYFLDLSKRPLPSLDIQQFGKDLCALHARMGDPDKARRPNIDAVLATFGDATATPTNPGVYSGITRDDYGAPEHPTPPGSRVVKNT